MWNEILSVLLDSELAERRSQGRSKAECHLPLTPELEWPEQAGHGDLVNAKMLKKRAPLGGAGYEIPGELLGH